METDPAVPAGIRKRTTPLASMATSTHRVSALEALISVLPSAARGAPSSPRPTSSNNAVRSAPRGDTRRNSTWSSATGSNAPQATRGWAARKTVTVRQEIPRVTIRPHTRAAALAPQSVVYYNIVATLVHTSRAVSAPSERAEGPGRRAGTTNAALLIRTARRSDADAVAAIYAGAVATAASFELEAPSADAMAERIVHTLSDLPWLVGEVDGRVIGYAYASRHRARAAYAWSAETSVFVAADARRRGAGSSLVAALFPLLAAQGYHRCFAGITLPNPASVRLHRSLGYDDVGVFERVGFKQGAWHDVAWVHRTLDDPAVEPPRAPFALLRWFDSRDGVQGIGVERLRERLGRAPT